ncbi:kynurenine 3-monooxygenase [Nitzschia inconspicua]|uniref:Kynurenine 3-monooxygenase n=1 Tax=Nitzschia inconspicua TaxID=303405 RepID=A0A9K3KT17_9STRA|nr:kynurenine 3-monooxygenase [Nitzschia inconspicua]
MTRRMFSSVAFLVLIAILSPLHRSPTTLAFSLTTSPIQQQQQQRRQQQIHKHALIRNSIPPSRPTTTRIMVQSTRTSVNDNSIGISSDTTASSSSSSFTTTTTTTPSSQSFQLPSRPASQYDAVIAGGGPAGLLTAIMLTQKYGPSYKIAVCERRPTIPPSPFQSDVWNDVARFYLLGIGHRGQSALDRFGILPDFIKASVEVHGRRDWQPGQTNVEDGRTTISNKDPPSRVLARDKLVGLLHEQLVEQHIIKRNATIDLLYGYQVEPLEFGNDRSHKNEDTATTAAAAAPPPVKVRITKCEEVVTTATTTDDQSTTPSSSSSSSYEASQDSQQVCNVDDYVEATTHFLVGADGASRTVARAMEAADAKRFQQLNLVQKVFARQRPFRITRFDDDNPRVYKSVPITLPSDWPRDLNYSARSRNSRITLEALPSDDKGNLCALLLMRPDDELAQPNVDPNKLRQFFDDEFPQFGMLVNDDEMARVAQKPASRLPVFRYAGPRLCMGSRTLVLGDAAHTVKPYYGLGANTALEDVHVLSDILDECRRSENPDTGENCCPPESVIPAAVQTFSDRRSGDAQALVTISRNMDRPGKLFLLNFLIPIILDGIFHKLAPKIFGPNMFGMFQMKGIGFKQIQRKKRLDRTLQLVILGTLASGFCVAVKEFISAVSRFTGKSVSLVSFGIVVAAALFGAGIKKMATTQKASVP